MSQYLLPNLEYLFLEHDCDLATKRGEKYFEVYLGLF